MDYMTWLSMYVLLFRVQYNPAALEKLQVDQLTMEMLVLQQSLPAVMPVRYTQ